jgi:hypothetical protein
VVTACVASAIVLPIAPLCAVAVPQAVTSSRADVGTDPVVLTKAANRANARVWAEQTVQNNGRWETAGEWRTPLSMALRGGHDAVVAFLRSAGARDEGGHAPPPSAKPQGFATPPNANPGERLAHKLAYRVDGNVPRVVPL